MSNSYQNVLGGKWRGYFLSAYGIAVKHGFVGSEEEWLFSLTAYGIAVNLGFVGSQEEWIASLKGENGKPFKYEDFTPEQLSELKNQIAEAFFSEATQILDDVRSERTAVDNALEEAQKSMESAKEAAEEASTYSGTARDHMAAAYGYAQEARQSAKEAAGAVSSSTSEELLADGTVNVETHGETIGDIKATDITNTLTLPWTENAYVSYNGAFGSGSNFRCSNLITLNKGETIRVTAAGGGNGATALISAWSEDGNTFVACLCKASGDGKTVETVEHTATETEYLRVSYNTYFTTKDGGALSVERITSGAECSQINGRNLVDKEARKLKTDIKALEELHHFENIYSAEYNVDGKWINSGGNIGDAENATYTSVPVEGGKDVYLCYNTEVNVMPTNVSAIRFANGETKISHVYDVNNYILDGQYMGYTVLKLTVPDGATQIEFTVRMSPSYDATETMIVSYTNLTAVLTGWKPKVWADKKWAVVGDSLSDPNTEYTTLYYFDYIREATGIKLVNMAKRGTSYAKGEPFGAETRFYDRILNVPTDVDVVTIFGSVNDMAANLPIGEIDDTELTTVCGYINATLDRLYSIIPTVQLGIIVPTPTMASNPFDGGNSITEGYIDKLIGICKKRSIPYLDLYRCSNLRPWDAKFRELAYSKDRDGDGTHPDETGNKIIAPRILEFLKTLLIY